MTERRTKEECLDAFWETVARVHLDVSRRKAAQEAAEAEKRGEQPTEPE